MDATNRNTALASAFVEELARCGMRHAVIAPGSRSSPLALALWRQPQIETRVVVDERSAGFLALGAAQATDAPVAVLTTSGTAAANLHPAVCEADEAGVPLVVLTSDRPPELREIGAGQTIDQLKLYGSAVRWFCEVGTHEADDDGLLHLRATACRAYALAGGDPRPGPVHLNLPWREPLGPEARTGEVTASSALARQGRDELPLTAVAAERLGIDEAAAGELAELIRARPHGLVVAGRQRDPALAPAVVALAEATGYPVLAEPTSQLRFGPHGRELVVSGYDAIAAARPRALEPELVIRFGDMPTSKALRGWIAALQDCPQIVFDPLSGWNEPTRHADVLVRADPVEGAARLAVLAGEAGERAWAERWVAADEATEGAVAEQLPGPEEPTEPGVHAALGRLYADGDLVYTASSMPIRDQEAFLRGTDARVTFLCNRGANGIDGLVSSGVGAAAASGRPTWIVTGDLGFFHDMNGLAALRDAGAPVRVVVLNNDGGGIFEFLPQATQIERDEFEALYGTPLGLDLELVARLHDLPFRRVEHLGELEAAAAAGTALIEVPVERRRNVELHRAISAAAVVAVRGRAATG